MCFRPTVDLISRQFVAISSTLRSTPDTSIVLVTQYISSSDIIIQKHLIIQTNNFKNNNRSCLYFDEIHTPSSIYATFPWLG